MVVQTAVSLHDYLLDLAQGHERDPDYGIEFACYFCHSDPTTVNLLEVSSNVLDSGDESFFAVNFAMPLEAEGVRHVRVIIVTPGEFQRAMSRPQTRGGELLHRLQRNGGFTVLVGQGTVYERSLLAVPG